MALTPASFATATLLAALSVEAHAQEAVDIGVIKDSDVKVVQNLLYPKTDKIEVGVYWYKDEETGKIHFDFEEMADEFEMRLSELDPSVVVMCSVE
jgi:hypothetical protein